MAQFRAHHIALRTPDFSRAKEFYTETLGLQVIGQIPGRDVVFIDIGGTTIELMAAPDQAPGATGAFAHLAFQVEDVDAVYQELAAKGVPFFIEPRDAGNLRIAFFRDPDGNPLELFYSADLHWD
jgi:glyoxylase I family protein